MANEVARRLVHASGAGVPGLYLLDLFSWPQVRYLLVAGLAVTVVLEVARLGFGFEWVVYDVLTREYEQDNLAGYALYVFSGSVTGLLFGPTIAVPAILMLTLGDPISGLLGSDELRTIKRPRVLIAMFLVCTGLALPFVPPVAAVLGGLAAMLADGAKPIVRGHVIDDNLTIPLVAAGAMTVGTTLAPVF
ncbi:dolichol kinase [Halorientalis sp. IM1011]|uniref:dolichol kinase n=1 Tax=Halorientalis sp. IM1011 TaxID=1932360 RepID=UPI00097CD060|nr:dolichol kinase [Halorientalis sp. IM1011]AQL42786.1 dolichol kinase [Halorientalis sp. IM1011]